MMYAKCFAFYTIILRGPFFMDTLYIYIFHGLLPPDEILPDANFTLSLHPSLAALLHGT